MADYMQQSNIQIQQQEQKQQEQKAVRQRQEQADLLSQQMMQKTMSDTPNALESGVLMAQKADFSELLKTHTIEESTGIDAVMASSEFKLETAKSKTRSDVLSKQSRLRGEARAEYIRDFISFYRNNAKA